MVIDGWPQQIGLVLLMIIAKLGVWLSPSGVWKMDRSEIEKNIGKYIHTPAGSQLLAGYQVNVLMEKGELKVYPDSIVLLCWSNDGGMYHHDAVDCIGG